MGRLWAPVPTSKSCRVLMGLAELTILRFAGPDDEPEAVFSVGIMRSEMGQILAVLQQMDAEDCGAGGGCEVRGDYSG